MTEMNIAGYVAEFLIFAAIGTTYAKLDTVFFVTVFLLITGSVLLTLAMFAPAAPLRWPLLLLVVDGGATAGLLFGRRFPKFALPDIRTFLKI